MIMRLKRAEAHRARRATKRLTCKGCSAVRPLIADIVNGGNFMPFPSRQVPIHLSGFLSLVLCHNERDICIHGQERGLGSH